MDLKFNECFFEELLSGKTKQDSKDVLIYVELHVGEIVSHYETYYVKRDSGFRVFRGPTGRHARDYGYPIYRLKCVPGWMVVEKL